MGAPFSRVGSDVTSQDSGSLASGPSTASAHVSGWLRAREQLECGISVQQRREGFRRRARRDGEVALYLAAEAVEVGAEHRGLFRRTERAQPVRAPPAATTQRDLTAGLGVAHPLGVAARRDEIEASGVAEQIDGRRTRATTLAAAHLEDPHVRGADTQPDEDADGAVEHALHGGGTLERTLAHLSLRGLTPARRPRQDGEGVSGTRRRGNGTKVFSTNARARAGSTALASMHGEASARTACGSPASVQ